MTVASGAVFPFAPLDAVSEMPILSRMKGKEIWSRSEAHCTCQQMRFQAIILLILSGSAEATSPNHARPSTPLSRRHRSLARDRAKMAESIRLKPSCVGEREME